MQVRKTLLGAVVFVAMIVVGCKPAQPGINADTVNTNTDQGMEGNVNADVNGTTTATPTDAMMAAPKEFTMTSFYELVDGKAKPQFSLKEITVKKGDKVRIKVTNTKGDHDFNIDAYGIRQATPLDQEVVIEFTADKAGDFEYYCGKMSHRELGQVGTLRVQE